MLNLLKIALSTWTLVWAFSFWIRTEGLRELLGVWFQHDTAGERIGRWDEGGLGGWINCPQCMAFLAVWPAALLARKFPALSEAFAALGLAQLLVRWFEAARVKVRWWE